MKISLFTHRAQGPQTTRGDRAWCGPVWSSQRPLWEWQHSWWLQHTWHSSQAGWWAGWEGASAWAVPAYSSTHCFRSKSLPWKRRCRRQGAPADWVWREEGWGGVLTGGVEPWLRGSGWWRRTLRRTMCSKNPAETFELYNDELVSWTVMIQRLHWMIKPELCWKMLNNDEEEMEKNAWKMYWIFWSIFAISQHTHLINWVGAFLGGNLVQWVGLVVAKHLKYHGLLLDVLHKGFGYWDCDLKLKNRN